MSPPDCHGLRAVDFSAEFECDQIINNRCSIILDVIITDTPVIVTSNADCLFESLNDSFMSTTINIVQAASKVSFSCKIYVKSLVDWNGIFNYLSDLNWPCIYRQDDCITSLRPALLEIIDKR